MSSDSATVSFKSTAWKQKSLDVSNGAGWKSMHQVMDMQAPSSVPLKTHIDDFLELVSSPTMPPVTNPTIGCLFLHTLQPHRSGFQEAGVHYVTKINEKASWTELTDHLLGSERASAGMKKYQELSAETTKTEIKSGTSRYVGKDISAGRAPLPGFWSQEQTNRPRQSNMHPDNPSSTSPSPPSIATHPNLSNLLIATEPARPSDRMDIDERPAQLTGFSTEEIAAIDVMMGFRRG